MDVKKIETINNDGTISEVEVNLAVWQFDKDDFWKQDWQERKRDGENSVEDIVYNTTVSKQLQSVSTEGEYIKKFEKDALYEAINKLSQKQKERIILHFFYEFTLEQIAKIENVDHSAISRSIKVALEKLKNALD